MEKTAPENPDNKRLIHTMYIHHVRRASRSEPAGGAGGARLLHSTPVLLECNGGWYHFVSLSRLKLCLCDWIFLRTPEE